MTRASDECILSGLGLAAFGTRSLEAISTYLRSVLGVGRNLREAATFATVATEWTHALSDEFGVFA